MSVRRLDGAALRKWAHTCVGDLIAHTDEINALNVFPVADSDTGTNMLFTMRSAVAEADGADERDIAAVAAALATGALRGARGNSGVILSQILRAVADVTAADQVTEIDAPMFGAALRHAVALVVAAMGGVPVAGTIVSVLQAAADAAEAGARGSAALADVIAAAASAAADALDRTPEQLAVLAEAGVVDSGGRGLLVLLDALCTTVTGSCPARPRYEPSTPVRACSQLQSAPAFEVMYVLAHCDADRIDELRTRLEALGDSVVIAAVADAGYSVHVHADDAGAAVEAALDIATPSRIQISALTAGPAGVAPSSWGRRRAVLAVVNGGGAAALFADEGAAVLHTAPPGQQPAVSAQQLLRAVVDTGAASVLVLPNGYVAAEELVAGCTAAIGWGVDVVPVPTRSMVQGLAALAVHDATRQAVDDGYTMAAAAGATRFGSVRVADQEALTWAGPCRVGDGLGIFGDEVLVVRHDVVAAGRGLIDLMLGVGGELVTVLLGADVDDHVAVLLREHVERHHLGTELLTYQTGHAGDALIIGVE
ncbi:DAK2 domain-containing protein [[Mycobacterium] wendilense]|uniref:DAK2 domain-containing protein n=1 Tax=[Mycobacterium] wendilense TaxID=3064284 RepID=A0ABM9MFT6_9MYCO|nr:DAK2 domain-containing protein [Mycolicibacterium sp. MU0050]CAJ1584064.1 DAK2 domain-containing protein [Mycolicibacterium sp. MU0050]